MNQINETSAAMLQGRVVTLKHPGADEIPYIMELWGHEETMAPVGGPIRWEPERMHTWYRDRVDPGGNSDCYFLIYNEDQVPVGEVSYHRWNEAEKSAGLNIKVHAQHRGKGYATDALTVLLKYFFEVAGGELMTDDFTGPPGPENLVGQRFIASMGFQPDKTPYDYKLSRSDWQNVLPRQS